MLEKNYNKLNFGFSITNVHEVLSTDICHNYGITSGCDMGCPALIDRDCRNIGEVLENTEMTEDERMELKQIYNIN